MFQFILLAAICHFSMAEGDHKCPGFRPEEVSYPTPYITLQSRSERCKSLFSRYNSTGTTNIGFVGQNTYYNPCKVDCGLCVEDELPDEKEEANVKRSYPPHISLKESIAKCPEDVEVYEQYMPDGVRCGPFHICENDCCVAKPEKFPNSKRLREHLASSRDVNAFSQEIPKEWTKPLTCTEEGYFQNPNDCHKFYRCYKSGVRGGFSRTLFECNPPTAVFDPQVRVCTPADEDGLNDVCGVLSSIDSVDY